MEANKSTVSTVCGGNISRDTNLTFDAIHKVVSKDLNNGVSTVVRHNGEVSLWDITKDGRMSNVSKDVNNNVISEISDVRAPDFSQKVESKCPANVLAYKNVHRAFLQRYFRFLTHFSPISYFYTP